MSSVTSLVVGSVETNLEKAIRVNETESIVLEQNNYISHFETFFLQL